MGIRQALHVCLLGLCILLLSPISHGQDHQLYLKAEGYLKKGQYTRFYSALEKLQKHPLLPYLQSKWLRKQFHKTPIQELDRFLSEFEGQPVATRLRRQWLYHLAKKQKWQLYLDYFQTTDNLKLNCHKVTALESTNQSLEAHTHGQELWLKGVSLPKACDNVFKRWKRHGYLSHELVWQRYVRALEKRQYKLVRYLKKKLPNSYKSKVKLARNLWRNPQNIFESQAALELGSDARGIILNKALKKQPSLFQSHHQHAAFQGLSDAQFKRLQHTALITTAKHSGPESYDWFFSAKKNKQLSSELEADFLLGAVKQQNWPLYTHFYKVSSEHSKTDARWLYWQARALESLGAKSEQSRNFYQQASVHRDFYGFLSSQHLGISPSMNHNPTHVPASIEQKTRLQPPVKRALALLDIGRISHARREWQYAVDTLDTQSKEALALLAGRLEWSDRAIMTLAQLKSWHDLQLRFPLAHEKTIEKAAQKSRISKNWIYGITRQESAFMYDARSPVGATGLMQLMPKTAKSLSRKLRLRYSSNRLLDPSYNIRLGSYYLKRLLKRYKGNRVLATAAYNAGPGNVKRWLKKNDGALDIWIESIPYKETKEYVQRVLTYSTIYSYRLGELQPILDSKTLAAWDKQGRLPLNISKAKSRQKSKG